MNFKKESGRDAKSNKLLFNQNITFSKGVTKIESLPIETVPEVAFFGRSNVGKSSLLNSITNKSKLAYTSKSPGRTRELNFFSLNKNSKTLINIVDMPGYGFAKASKGQIKGWTNLSDLYLKTRKNLRRVFLLIDSRRKIMPIDNETVKKVAKLAKIKISETEETKLIVELNNILGWVDELKKVNTDKTEPMLYVFNESMVMREDKAISEISNDSVLKNAPETKSGFFVVPKVVE